MYEYDHPFWRRLLFMQRMLLGLLLGGILMLLLDIRFEHKAVLSEKWQSWIPIVYLSTLLILIPIAIFKINRTWRNVLVAAFAGLAIVGLLGYWFHGQGEPLSRIHAVVMCAMQMPGHLYASDDTAVPPILAPLALVGLGAIGVFVSLLHPHHKTTSHEPGERT